MILIISQVLLSGCNSDFRTSEENEKSDVLLHINKNVTADEFIKWCVKEENHLLKTKSISEIKYELMFVPAETMAYQDLKNENFDLNKLNKISDSYKEMSYFNFRINLIGGKGELLKYKLNSASEYDERIKYASFEIEKDIFLLQDNDTLFPGLCHFERIFELAPYMTIMLAFDNKKFNREKEFTIVYNDKLFEKGLVKFTYLNNQLVDLPKIVKL